MQIRLFAGLAAAITVFPAVALSDPDQYAPGAEPPAAQSSNAQAAPDEQAPPNDEVRAKPAHRLLTPEQKLHQGVIKGVAEAPLRDLNVMNDKIPPVLKVAMSDTYARPQPDSCQGIRSQVRTLSDALGPDYDEAVAQHRGLGSKARNGILDGMREDEKAYIPFDGLIRFVTGASRHDQYVRAAIQAGAARRAYLKGLGESRGCGLPAAPTHFASEAVRKEPGFGDYPRAPRHPRSHEVAARAAGEPGQP